MITQTEFNDINYEIKESIQHSLDKLKKANQSDYVLFLAEGEYRKELYHPATKSNPYCIDNMEDHYKDESRLSFLTSFLSLSYSFPPPIISTDDKEFRMQLELMAYTHIWESKPFLKKLYRLAHLCNGEQYVWNVPISDKEGKHNFIRHEIKQIFENRNNNIAEIIKKGYHSSLRNAFAHSEFSFDTINGNKRIVLYNFKGDNWELQQISFDDWSKRFVYSALLSYNLLDLVSKHRKNLSQLANDGIFQIKQPSETNGTNMVWIKYLENINRFEFVK